MGLYLGSGEKVKIVLGNAVYCLNFFTNTPMTNGVMLLSSDNYILKDSNGLYLTLEEGD